MSWSEVFYIADIRDMYKGTAVERTPENLAYQVLIRPNNFVPSAGHFALNTSTSYEKCLEAISSYVSRYWTPANFYESHMRMSSPFIVESEHERRYRSDYYRDYFHVFSAWFPDIDEAIRAGKHRREIIGDNVSAVIDDVDKPEGCRKLVSFTGDPAWVGWFDNLLEEILEFKGHTKLELYKKLKTWLYVDDFTAMLRTFREHGVRGIKRMKRLDKADLVLCLIDFMNSFTMEEETDYEQ